MDALILDELPDGRFGPSLPEAAQPTSVFDGDWPFPYERVYFSREQLTRDEFVNVYENETLVVFRVRIHPPTAQRPSSETDSVA